MVSDVLQIRKFRKNVDRRILLDRLSICYFNTRHGINGGVYMKKVGLGILILLILWSWLAAVPSYLHNVPAVKAKGDVFGTSTFHLWGSNIYAVDNNTGSMRVWDTSKMAFSATAFAKLPSGAQISDITGDVNAMYLLDSKNSCIYIYSYDGVLMRSISTKGAPDVQFKNAIRILVNYQCYIFVLDAGRNELLSFTNEGMFMGKVSISSPKAMTLGNDQLIRVLALQPKYSEVQIYNQYLKPTARYQIQTIDNKNDPVADISVNQYNELYVIYAGSTKIAKVNAEGRLIPKSNWGYKDKGNTPSAFLEPSLIRNYPVESEVWIAILDSKQRTIKLYVDNEVPQSGKLVTPELTMRPSLEESDTPKFVDAAFSDSLEYYIHDAMLEGNKLTRVITSKANGRTRFVLPLPSLAAQKVKSFDAITVSGSKLFVADSKSHQVLSFDKLSGRFISSFGQKGAKEGRLDTPISLASGNDGLIYIAEKTNSRITILNNETMFVGTVPLKESKLSPQKIRYANNSIYVLANGISIYEIPISNTNIKKPIVQGTKISSFDIIYENKLAWIDAATQQLVVMNNLAEEMRYFAMNKNAAFPHFANIAQIGYNDRYKSVLVSDSQLNRARVLRFIYCPVRPDLVSIGLTKDAYSEITWKAAEGIRRWLVTEFGGDTTLKYEVSEPRYIVSKPQSSIKRYFVASLSDDNKEGPPSNAIEDAYSYARYLKANNSFTAAIAAFRQAASVITDSRIDDEIVSCYVSEAGYHISRRDYVKALTSMESAIAIAGQTREYIMETVRIYKLMKDYRQAISYLERFREDNNQNIQNELISLYYLQNDYNKVHSLSTTYLSKFQRDSNILQYLAWANEKKANPEAALANMRELVALEDSYYNNLKIAELLVITKQYDQALSHLQRMLNKFMDQETDEVYKLRGDIHFALGNYSLAEEFYSIAVKQNASKAEYYYLLGKAHTERRNSTEALANFAKAYQLNPQNVSFGLAYSDALRKVNRYAEALKVLDDVNEFVDSNESSNAFHIMYYELLTIEQRYDDAHREIQTAVNYDPDNLALRNKLREAADARDYYNQNKPEVEIKSLQFYTLYPSLQEHYRSHPIGSISLFNNRGVPIQNVKVTVNVPQLSLSPFSTTVRTLIANQAHNIDIILPISQNLYSLSLASPVSIATEVVWEYSFGGEPKRYSNDRVAINLLQASAMDWSNRKQFASFVNPGDENLRQFVNNKIINPVSHPEVIVKNNNIIRAIKVWSFLRANGVRYEQDPSTSNSATSENDYVQYPFQTLARKSGDCEDLLALLASSLSTIGIDCAFIDIPGHVMLAFNTNMSRDELIESGIELSHLISVHGKYWLPLETTQIDKSSFIDSWFYAIRFYSGLTENDIFPDLIEFADAHRLYPPARFSEPISSSQYNNINDAITLYKSDIENISILGKITREDEYRQAIARYPNNLNVANQYALWCVKNGKPAIAKDQWEQILRKDPANISALINLGNLFVESGEYSKARTYYQNAMKANVESEMVLRNLIVLEYKNSDLRKAKEYFNLLKDRSIIRNLDIKMYSDLLN